MGRCLKRLLDLMRSMSSGFLLSSSFARKYSASSYMFNKVVGEDRVTSQ